MHTDSDTHHRLLRAYILLTAIYAIFATIVFKLAATYMLPFFWGILLIQAVVTVVALSILDPELLEERLKPKGKDLDPLCTPAICLLYPTAFVLAVLDGHRFHIADTVPVEARLLGLVLTACGWALFVWAMKCNFFFSAAIRLQPDRGQQVIDQGPYSKVRHPGYSGALLVFLGESLAMGSWLGVGVASLMLFVLLRRTLIEEKMLHTGLPGYGEYANRVKFRWIPGIW